MKNFKFLSTSFLVNPGAGSTTYNNTFFTAQLSSSRSYLDALIIDSFLLADASGNVLQLDRLNFQVQLIDSDSSINDSQVYTPTIGNILNQRICTVVYRSQIVRNFFKIDRLLTSPQKVRIFVAATFPALGSATDSLQASVTLRWFNVPILGRPFKK